MAVRIRLHDIEATCDGYAWQCDDPAVLTLLDSVLDPIRPFSSDPDPDMTAAQHAVELFGAVILEADESPELPEGMIL